MDLLKHTIIMIGFGILCCFWAGNRYETNDIQPAIIKRDLTLGKPPVMIVIEPIEDEVIIIEETESENDILDEKLLKDVELLAQLVHAEAGNQDLDGKRLVADVVLNRVESELFPNTIEEVIFQRNPVQFSVTVNGAFEKAASTMDQSDYDAAYMELTGERIDTKILYFGTGKFNGTGFWKHGDHWFSY